MLHPAAGVKAMAGHYYGRRKKRKLLRSGDRPENFKLTESPKERRYEEDKEQISFVATLRELQEKNLFATVPDLEFFEFSSMPEFGNDGSDLQNIIKGKRNKAKGYLAGWFDITVIWKFKGKRPNFGLIEMKAKDGTVSEKQQQLRERFVEHRVNHAIAYGSVEALQALKSWGLLPPAYAAML
jgi:hypothetical protein